MLKTFAKLCVLSASFISDVKARNILKNETKIRELSHVAMNQTTLLRIVSFCVNGEAASNSTLQSFLMGYSCCIHDSLHTTEGNTRDYFLMCPI